jgi:two-component system, sensor histidine kinase and response regulator
MPLPDLLLKAVYEQAALPMVLIDGRGLLAIWNPAFESLFRTVAGVGPERLAASFFDFVVEHEGARLDYYAAEILLGGRGSAWVESQIRAADGTIRWLRMALSRIELPVASAAAVERFLLCTAEDVTDRVLRERRLRDAKEEAEKATHTKSQFLANMSHEIRTPIQTILGVVELLRETELDSEQSEYANQVRFSADVLLGLINDILDFSKIEAGKLQLEQINFDLPTTVEEVIDILSPKVQEKGLELAYLVEPDVPSRLRGDPGRLRQVLLNLAGNAVKFTEKGEIVIRVSLAAESGTHAKLRFEVTDTGIGIKPENCETIFDSFVQEDVSTTRRYGGTGLGLAICKQLVEQIGRAHV